MLSLFSFLSPVPQYVYVCNSADSHSWILFHVCTLSVCVWVSAWIATRSSSSASSPCAVSRTLFILILLFVYLLFSERPEPFTFDLLPICLFRLLSAGVARDDLGTCENRHACLTCIHTIRDREHSKQMGYERWRRRRPETTGHENRCTHILTQKCVHQNMLLHNHTYTSVPNALLLFSMIESAVDLVNSLCSSAFPFASSHPLLVDWLQDGMMRASYGKHVHHRITDISCHSHDHIWSYCFFLHTTYYRHTHRKSREGRVVTSSLLVASSRENLINKMYELCICDAAPTSPLIIYFFSSRLLLLRSVVGNRPFFLASFSLWSLLLPVTNARDWASSSSVVGPLLSKYAPFSSRQRSSLIPV